MVARSPFVIQPLHPPLPLTEERVEVSAKVNVPEEEAIEISVPAASVPPAIPLNPV